MRRLLLALLCLSLTACATAPEPGRIVTTKREAVLPPADMRTRCEPARPAATIGELLQQEDDRIRCLLDQLDRQQKWYDDIMNREGMA